MVKTTKLMLMGSVMFGVAMPAVAQIAPPPPPASEDPVYVPPVRPQQVQRPATRRTPTDAAKVRGGNVPNIPYPPIVEFDDDGKVIRLEGLLDIHAFRANPTIRSSKAPQIMAVLRARHGRLERIIIENIDMVTELDGGILDRADFSEISKMGEITSMIKPLVVQTSLTYELQDLGAFSRVQAAFNDKIMKEYQKALSREAQQSASGDTDPMMEYLRQVLRDSYAEALVVYTGMLVESAPNAADLADDAGLGDAGAALVAAASGGEPDIGAMKVAFASLVYEHQQGYLNAVRNSRENPDMPPIPMMDISREGKIEPAEDEIGSVSVTKGEPEAQKAAREAQEAAARKNAQDQEESNDKPSG